MGIFERFTHRPPWKAYFWSRDNFGPGIWTVTTDRGDPADEYDVLDSADEEECRFIAGAPGVYLALAELVRLKDLKESDPEQHDRLKEAAWEAARIALAKVEGR